MMKKIISLLLCLLMVCAVFAGCAKKKNENDKGAYIYMYLTDMVYDFDPAVAYINESSLKIVSLLFDNLFTLDENGKVKKSLASDYVIKEDDNVGEYKMIITLNNTSWSDGTAVSANDIVYSWKRILDVENSFDAACLLFDIKNARAAKQGDVSIDDVGIYALNQTQLEIEFETKINYDQFLLNLTSYALVPLREDIVEKTEDWAKKPSTMVSSGPFRIRKISYDTMTNTKGEVTTTKEMTLERNTYYYRNISKDKVDKSVTPYRIIVDYTKSAEEILQAYENGDIFYVGNIPLSMRAANKDTAKITDALSTHSYMLNENAVVRYYNASEFAKLSGNTCIYSDSLQEGTDGDKIFANANVRKALSLAIDRQTIADAVVFAKPATGLLSDGIFNSTSSKKSFRKVGGDIIASSANLEAAKSILSSAGVDASKYMFSISVASYDEIHTLIAQKVAEAWNALGFHVAINAIDVIVNDDILKTTLEVSTDIKDDIFTESYKAGKFEVAAVDYVALSADAYSMLAGFAKSFSGQGMNMSNQTYSASTNITGYDSEAYNALIDKAFAEKDIEKRADILHEAEKLLLEDMPIIPIIFNQNATLTSKDLSNVVSTYYCPATFKKAKLKNYEKYIPVEE